MKYKTLGALLILGFLFRLPLLNSSFWLDEAAQVLESTRPFSQQLNIARDFQPPLFHYLIHFASFFSVSEWWLRLVGAVIPSLVTIAVCHEFGRRYFSQKVGVLAAIILASHSFFIFYSQELRPYALATMWAMLSWWFLLNWLNFKHNNPNQAIYFALATVGGLYSMYLYPLIILAQWLWVTIFARSKFSGFLTTQLVAGIAFLPWLPAFWQQLQIGTGWQTQVPGWAQVVSITSYKALPLVAGKMLLGNLDLGLVGWQIVAVSLIAIVGGWLAWRKWRAGLSKTEWAILIWLVAPILAAWLISFVVPVIRPKRLLTIYPAFALIIAVLAEQVSLKASTRISILKVPKTPQLANILLGTLLAVQLFAYGKYLQDPKLQRENWRGLISEIESSYSPVDAAVVMAFDEPFAPWRWYASSDYEVFVTGRLYIPANTNLSHDFKQLTEFKQVLVFDYLRDITDPGDVIGTTLHNFGYTEIGAITYPNIGPVRVFVRPSELLSVSQ